MIDFIESIPNNLLMLSAYVIMSIILLLIGWFYSENIDD